MDSSASFPQRPRALRAPTAAREIKLFIGPSSLPRPATIPSSLAAKVTRRRLNFQRQVLALETGESKKRKTTNTGSFAELKIEFSSGVFSRSLARIGNHRASRPAARVKRRGTDRPVTVLVRAPVQLVALAGGFKFLIQLSRKAAASRIKFTPRPNRARRACCPPSPLRFSNRNEEEPFFARPFARARVC